MRNKTMRRGLAWILSAATIMTSVPVSAEEIVLETDVVSEEEAAAEEQSVDADLEEEVIEDDADIESRVIDDEEEAVLIDGTDGDGESSPQAAEEGQAPVAADLEDLYSYVYTGQEITPVLAEGETVVDGTGSAVNVGEYTVELMDAEGVTREQVWNITPAELTATCYYAEVTEDTEASEAEGETTEDASEETASIEVAVEVTGFVEGEDETNAAGYVAPQYTQPATLEDAATMKAFGGEADNYTFVYADSVNTGSENNIAAYAADAHELEITGGSESTGDYYSGGMTVNDDAVWEKVKDAKVQITTSVSGDSWESAKTILNGSDYYDGALKKFVLAQMKLVDNSGNEIVLTDKEEKTLSSYMNFILSGQTGVEGDSFQFFTLKGTEVIELKNIKPSIMSGSLMANISSLSGIVDIAVVGDKGLEKIIAEGTYTVTANLTVWGEDNEVLKGQKVYMTNTDMPPLTPAKDNAKLVVKKDANGKKVMTVTVSNLNPVFMLQEINSGTNVTVVDTETVPVAVEDFRYTTRIDKVVMTLANTDGVYELGYCKQSPQIAVDQEMKMHLEVDFDTLIKEFSEPEDGEYSFKHVFTDEETGVSVSVKTTEEELGKALEIGKLEVADVKSLYDAQIQSEHTKKVNFKAYNIGFVDRDGKLVSLKDRKNTEVIVTIPSSWEKARLMPYRDGEFVWVKNNYGDGTVSYGGTTLDELGTFALIDDYQVSNWITSTTTKTKVTATYSMPSRGLWVNYASARSDSSLGTSSDYSDNSDYKGNIRKGTKTERGRYYVGFGSNSQSVKYITGADGSMIGDNSAYPEDYSKLSMTFPYTEGNVYYLVKENGTTVTAKLLNGAVDGSNITVDIISQQGTTAEDGYRLMQALWNGLNKKTASLDTEVAYILETTESVKYASMPTATWITSSKDTGVAGEPYTYDGKEHTGYAGGENCTITGDNTATQAGTYTVTVTPNEGYTWTDGTSEAKNITWTIEKAELKVQYKGEVVSIGGNAKKEVEFSGWVNDENENTARNFDKTKFYVDLPDDYNTKEQTLNPIPSVEEGANEECDYTFVFTDYGKLAVTEKTVIEKDGIDEKIADMSGSKFRYGKSLSGSTTREMLSFVEKGETAELKLPEGFETKEITRSEIGKKKLYLYTDADHIFSDGKNFISYDWAVLQIVDKPELKMVFTYNGQEYTVGAEVEEPVCVGTKESTQKVKATEAGNYTATVYYNASQKYIWRDQISDWESYDLRSMGEYEIDWSIVPVEEKTVASTETVTANLYIKASDAKVAGLTVLESLAGADGKAYLTNPNAPVAGSNEDQDPDWKATPPITPVEGNATLITYTDGTYAVKVPVKNAVFTLQKLGNCDEVSDVIVTKREGNYKAYTNRIDSITIPVAGKEGGSYIFNGCVVYPTLLDTQNKGTSYTVPLTLEVGKVTKSEALSIANAEVTGIADATYTGSAITQPNLKVTLGGGLVTLTEGTDYTVTYANNVNAGTATITITGIGNYKDSITRTFTIKAAQNNGNQNNGSQNNDTPKKADQTINVKVGSKTYKYKNIQKKAASFTIGASASGSVSYRVTSAPKKGSKYISVNSKGKVTLKKKAPAGTYQITVFANATADKNVASRIVTVNVAKNKQSLTAKVSKKTVKATALKKKAAKITVKAKGKGKLTYKVTAVPAGADKYISVTKKGKVTLKKGAPKGTYKIQVTAGETSRYAKAVKTVSIKVK